jgi:hypothetical protein
MMEDRDSKEIIDTIWLRVKKKHLFPEIPLPKVGPVKEPSSEEKDQGEAVGLEMKERQITINPAFLAHLKGKMPKERVIEALLDHGITHYTFCPWDFYTHVMLYAEAKRVVSDKDLAKQVANYFMDVVSDTHCVKERETGIPELYRHLKRSPIEETIASLYQKIWGIDLGVSSSLKGSKANESVVRRLTRIPYLDRSRWSESIQRFARSIKPLLLQEQEEQREGTGAGEGSSLGDHDLDRYSNEEIDQGLRDYARKSMALSEFREIVEDFGEEFKEIGYSMEGGMGRGRGTLIDADILFYMKLAESYSLPIRKTSVDKKGILHPHSHAPWEVGTPYHDVDVWTSFGKIMPGITQIWRKREGKGRGRIDGVPDCFIAVDSSGSMINPRKSLSYAVLGAACAADAYLRNDARVAVYNFSDAPMGGKDILDYTHKREEIYRVLCKYFGGGTALDLEDILSLVQGRKNLDLFIITDMKITNLETLISFFGQIQNRITAVHIGENPYASRFERAVEKKHNISIYTVKRKEDIPYIVLGKINEYFHQSP